MGSPSIFGANTISTLLQGGLAMSTGQLIKNDGPKNYITYSTPVRGLATGWSLGHASLTNAFPSGTPTFGSGAAAGLQFVPLNSPINSQHPYDYWYDSTGASTAGDFVATDPLTMDSEAQGNVLGFRFAYNGAGGALNTNYSGTSSNTNGVAFYDVTNSAWIQPAGVYNLVQNSGVGYCTGTVQIPINCTSLRMVIFNANASSGSYTLKMDDFFLGPQVIVAGYAGTEPVAYTPTFTGFGTPSNVVFYSWRDGAILWVSGKFTCGTTTATEARITLGYQGVSGGVTSTSTISTIQLAGEVISNVSTSAPVRYTLIETSKTYLTFGRFAASDTGAFNKSNGNDFNTGDVINFIAQVPIAGWSSNTVMSNDTDTRVIAASYYMSANSSPGTGNQLNFDTSLYDTAAAVTTGASWKFTAPVAGIYDVFVSAGTTSGTTNIDLYKTGVAQARILGANSSSNAGSGWSVSCKAGDTIDLRAGGSGTFLGGSLGTGNQTVVTIQRLSGPATIAATESVNCKYQNTAGTSITSSAATVPFATKIYDSHNAFNGSVFTAPVSGKYQITARFRTTGVNNSTSQAIIAYFKVTSTPESLSAAARIIDTRWGVGVSNEQSASGSETYWLNAGDTMEAQLSNSNTVNLGTSAGYNVICIERVGN